MRLILPILLLLTLQWAAAEEILRLRVQASDGEPAEVLVEGESLGSTGKVLEFDITDYRKPLFLNIVLQREGAVPSLHNLEVDTKAEVWEPEPLAVYRPLRQISLRTKPVSERIQIEKRDGTLIPAGQNSELRLEVDKLSIGRAFQAKPVTLVMTAPGYLPKRITAQPQIWSAEIYPPKDEPALALDPAPGWRAWWTRTTTESPLIFLVTLLAVAAIIAIARLRYHYLREIEKAHGDLKLWVDRLNTFVDGSQSLAAPLSLSELAENATLQARRLTRCDEALLQLVEPTFESESSLPQETLTSLTETVRKKGHPLRLDSLVNTEWKSVSEYASLLAVPISFKGNHTGVLFAFGKSPAQFSETDQEALLVLAFQLAGGVERSRLHAETVDAYEKLAESEAQLVQSAKMSAIGQLAAGVAHELNTPLNAISIGVEMGESLMERNPTKAKKRLGLAMAAIEKAEKIVAKLLYYSREAKMEVKLAPLKDLIDDTLEFINFQLKHDGIKVTREEEPGVEAEFNLNELQQVLNNLILNARDAIVQHDAPKEIRIETKQVDDQTVEILVTDQGPGVPADIQPKIFDPFFTTKNMGDGTGLGLSVSSKIMENHGGSLTLRQGDSGTTFVMNLPVHQ